MRAQRRVTNCQRCDEPARGHLHAVMRVPARRGECDLLCCRCAGVCGKEQRTELPAAA